MNKHLICRWLCGAILAVGVNLPAITPADALASLNKGEKLTFIDVRPLADYKVGHIANAISVPAQLVPAKQLPPLGRVVVYDDGLGQNTATAAAEALNRKTGISAEALQGGYASWQDGLGATTEMRGVTPVQPHYITYDTLKKLQSADVVLVDLRQSASATSRLNVTNKLTNLAAEFPQARVAASPQMAIKRTSSTAASPLFVLIDNGDGSAVETARVLRAGGTHRCVILAGGEKMLERHGQPGLNRLGSTSLSRMPSATNAISK
jgi:rhodanese-related sulfurtransferase